MGKFSQPRGAAPQPEEDDVLELTQSMEDTTSPTPEELPEADLSQILEEPDYPPKKKNGRAKSKKIMLICLCSVAAVLLIGVIAALVFLFAIDPNEGKILNNVSIAGINVGNMTKMQAKAAVKAATEHTFTEQDMVIDFPDIQMRLSPADTGAALDLDALIDAAYDYGRVGTDEEKEQALAASMNAEHPVALLPYLTLNTDYIRKELDDYANSFNSTYLASTVTIVGEKPILDANEEGFQLDAPGQTIEIFVGNPGRYIDINKVYNRVLDAYSFNQFQLTVEMDAPEEIPEEIDLQALYEQYCTDPKDASVDPETYEVTMETYGYSFDTIAAQELMDASIYGDTITIPMHINPPDVLGGPYKEIYFRDILCEYKTEHTTNVNRNNNLELACAAINGTVLAPGEEFDYNTVVGERTKEKGYKAAAAYSSGKTVQTIGGGVCQVSSTIYYCCLIADLEIVNRTQHSYVSDYMPMGMDATVSYGGPEFTFKNSTNYPIRIETWVADGYVHCKLVGTDEKDYYIVMEYEVIGTDGPSVVYEEYTADNNPEGYRDGQVIQTAYKGYWVNTYKNKYSKATDELISREFDRMSAYKKRDKIIAKIVAAAPPAEAAPGA